MLSYNRKKNCMCHPHCDYLDVWCLFQRAVVLSDRAAEGQTVGEPAEPPEQHGWAAAAPHWAWHSPGEAQQNPPGKCQQGSWTPWKVNSPAPPNVFVLSDMFLNGISVAFLCFHLKYAGNTWFNLANTLFFPPVLLSHVWLSRMSSL